MMCDPRPQEFWDHPREGGVPVALLIFCLLVAAIVAGIAVLARVVTA